MTVGANCDTSCPAETNACANTCGKQGWCENPCTVRCPKPGLNFPNCQNVQPVLQVTDCGPCCWDMSLCTICPPSCNQSVKVNISIENNTNIPQIDNDTGAYLSIYNYTVQRFVTRSIKFITAYYDFVGGMINSTSSQLGDTCCEGDANELRPSPAYPSQVKDRVFQAWQWVWERMETVDSFDLFCEPDCLLQPVLTLLTLAGSENSTAFRNALLKKSLGNLPNYRYNCKESVQTNPCCRDKSACAVAVGTLGAGKDFTDEQFYEWGECVANVIDIIETILDALDMTNDPLSAEQLLQKICDCYIKCACCDNPAVTPGSVQNARCDIGCLFTSFNRCGEPYDGRQFITSDTSTAQIVKNTYGGCNSCLGCKDEYRPDDLTGVPCGEGTNLKLGDVGETTPDCCLPADIPCSDPMRCPAPSGKLFIPGTKERIQAAIFVLDWIAFLLFDRDADKSQFKDTKIFSSGNCFCPEWEGESPCFDCNPEPTTEESWLKTRCKLGTGNGKCVVAAGACAGFRQVDDFKPMQTSLVSLKHFLKLLTLRVDEGYQTNVTDIYNSLLAKLHDLYLGEEFLTFNIDCAAPQFCCTTQWTQAGRAFSGVRAPDVNGEGCCKNYCDNPCACCNLTIPEYTVQCFARLKCSCVGPICETCTEGADCCNDKATYTYGSQVVVK